MGALAAPNRAAILNSLPARDRGTGGGINSTFQISAQVLSIGIFFTPPTRAARLRVDPLARVTERLPGARSLP